jgi:glycosyltransferase involved in cell wall biosynthesis
LLDSSRVVFNSSAQKADILSTYGVSDGAHIEVIPPGVEQQYYGPDESGDHLADAIGIDSSTKVIGSVITPRPVKRLDRAFGILATVAEDTDVLYVVVGDSEDRATYENMAEEKGVADRVHWAGYQEQTALAEWYALFDVTILTSEWESFGMSITESYLCETPCVAFDVGGMSDQIVDGSTGHLVEPYDLSAFAEAIEAVLSDPEQAAAFGKAGREYVRERFTLDSVATQYGALLSALQ